jgi:hypothetical protein
MLHRSLGAVFALVEEPAEKSRSDSVGGNACS